MRGPDQVDSFLLARREPLPHIVFHLLDPFEQLALRTVKVAPILNDAGLVLAT
jgi:hypothetical protein